MTLAGLLGGMAISILLVANTFGSDAPPASTTWSMFFGLAEANTSAGAPELICSARAELAPKLNVTFAPGLAASNCLPSSVNDSVSEAAANTVMLPDSDGEPHSLADGLARNSCRCPRWTRTPRDRRRSARPREG